MPNSFSDDSLPLDFVDELADGRSLLYVQGRLLLLRLGRVLSSNAQLGEALNDSTAADYVASGQQEVEQAGQLAELARTVALDASEAACWSGGGALSGVRLLGRLKVLCGGPEPGALLRCLRTAVGVSADHQRKIWTACLRLADSAGAYSQLKKEVQGSQCFHAREIRLIQRALILLDTFL